MPLQIRSLRRADASAFLEVHRASIHGLAAGDYSSDVIMAWAPLPVTAEAVSALLRDWNHEFRIIAEDDGRAVGVGALSVEKAELTACYVSPADCSRGVGTAITNRLEETARSAGIEFLELNSSITAQRFYQRRGYEIVARGEHRLSSGQAMEAIRMRKRLVPSS